MKLTKLLALIGVGAALECFNANAAIQIAYFPPVPESWNVTIEANTVIYTFPEAHEHTDSNFSRLCKKHL